MIKVKKISKKKYNLKKTKRSSSKNLNNSKKKTTKKNKDVVLKTPISKKEIILEIPEPKPKKKRNKNPIRMYFTQDTEDAIHDYNFEDDDDIREMIFQDRILFPFQKLIENIFNTFKFSYFETGPQDVQKECLTHLVSNMHKYKKDKGKAFSYFSIIAKHYLILLNNTNYKKFNQNIEIGDDKEENTIQLQHVDPYYADQEMSEFIRLMVEFWENNVNKIFTKQRDLDIANAVIELFRNSDRIDAYNKKALYLYIREMAMCKTQQITKVINKMKQYHDNIQKSYLNDGDVNTNHPNLM